jgi:hypothetical protein
LGEACEVGRSSWGGDSDTGVCVRACVRLRVVRCSVSFHRVVGWRTRAGWLCNSRCGGGGAEGGGGVRGAVMVVGA